MLDPGIISPNNQIFINVMTTFEGALTFRGQKQSQQIIFLVFDVLGYSVTRMFFTNFFHLLLQLSLPSIKSIANKICAFIYQTQILDMSRLSFLALQDTRFSVSPVTASVNRYLKLQLEYKNTDHEVTSRCDIHKLRKTEDKENKRAF